MEIVNLITSLVCAFMLGMYTSTLAIKPQLSKKEIKEIHFWIIFYIVCCILNTICAVWL